MGVYETFSKRQRRLQSRGKPVRYVFDDLPARFREQVNYIWKDTIDQIYNPSADWKFIHDKVARELGLPYLAESPYAGQERARCYAFLMQAPTLETLDLIEVSFRYYCAVYGKTAVDSSATPPEEAIDELNQRFQEHSLGYKFMNGELRRVDSEYVEQNAVEPALDLLHGKHYDGALDEFMRAHKHLLSHNTKEAVANATSALESAMKTICDRKGWSYSPTATGGDLVGVLVKNGMLPGYIKPSFNALAAIRNESDSAHGQGASATSVPMSEATFALNLAASLMLYAGSMTENQVPKTNK